MKGEIIKEHNKINHDKRDNEVCSLRRTKSLAVIREETFNDLNIAAPTTRRSQLIPRAKLIDRHFFKDRYAQRIYIFRLIIKNLLNEEYADVPVVMKNL